MRKKKQVLALFMAVSMMVNMLICIPVGAAVTDAVPTETEADAKNIETEEYINDTGSIIEKYHVQSFLCDISNIVPAGEKPELNEVLEMLPKELEVICWEKEESIMMPVTWECAGDYEGTSYYYYQFQPIWDEEIYVVDEELQVPYFGLMLGEGAFQTLGVTANSNETVIYNFLKNDLGCNTATAVGILANIFCESSFNPTAEVVDTNGLTSYGICQWNGARFTALQNYCNQNGYSYSSVTGQLNYLKYELSTSEKNAWNNMQGIENSANGAYTAGYRWAQYFERCSSVYFAGRGTLARDTYWPVYRDVPIDTQPPVISDVYIKDRSATGYTVHCIVTDNMGFGYVRFPTWSINNGQDDLIWGDPGEIAGTGWELNYRVNISDHNNETNCQYVTHIYAYDAAGNVTSVSAGEVFVDATAPTITDVKVTDVSEEGYTVTCTVSDNDMIDRVVFPTWTHENGQDDLDGRWQTLESYRGKITGDVATFRVNTSDHNNEMGRYYTHIYAYDKSGNGFVRWLAVAVGEDNAVSPSVTRNYGGNRYVLYDYKINTWTEAKSYCESLGGHLVTITSQEEQEVVNSLLESGKCDGYFIGMTDEITEGKWNWVTGEAVTYTNWDKGQPDNWNNTENYGVLFSISGNWNDATDKILDSNGSAAYGFICEFDSSETFSPTQPTDPKPTQRPTTPKPTVTQQSHKSHVGKTFVVNGLKYKVTKDGTSGREVRVTSMVTDTDTLNIPVTVTNAGWKESFKVTSIKAKAFKNKSFAKAVIGNNVTKIGPNAFYHCWYLQKVVIGKSVKSIGVRAFYKCDYLKKVNIKSTVLTTVKKNAFKKLYWKAVIKVPKGKKQAYKGLLKGKIDRGTKVK